VNNGVISAAAYSPIRFIRRPILLAGLAIHVEPRKAGPNPYSGAGNAACAIWLYVLHTGPPPHRGFPLWLNNATYSPACRPSGLLSCPERQAHRTQRNGLPDPLVPNCRHAVSFRSARNSASRPNFAIHDVMRFCARPMLKHRRQTVCRPIEPNKPSSG